MYLLYCHINKINGKRYVGLTSKEDPEERWRKNGKGYQSSPHFWKAIQQYGWDNFEHIILAQHLTREEASEQEKYYISLWETINPEKGYNLREGGLDGFSPCQETLEKAAEATHKRKGTYGKKVICLTTGDVFQSAAEAVRWCGSSKVYLCCKGERTYAGKHPVTGEALQWDWAEEDEEVTLHCIENLQSKPEKKDYEVVCTNTNQIFSTPKEAAAWCGLKDIANIYRCAKGERQSAGKHPETKEKLKWIFREKGDK